MEKNYHTDNKSFMIYKDWEDLLSALENDEQVGQLFKALFAFAKRGEEAEFVGALKMAFIVMRNAIERDGEKWEETCCKNSDNIKKRWNKNKQTNTTEYDRIAPNTNCTDIDKDTDTDKDTDKDIVNKKKRSASSSTHKFGEYNHVKLTEEQYNKLVAEYGESQTALYIQKVDEYCQQHGKPYKDYNLTIRKWIAKDTQNKPAPMSAEDYTSGLVKGVDYI